MDRLHARPAASATKGPPCLPWTPPARDWTTSTSWADPAPDTLAHDGLLRWQDRVCDPEKPLTTLTVQDAFQQFAAIDLLATGDARCIEAAQMIYEEHLARLFTAT